MPLSAARADTFMQNDAANFRKIAATEEFTRASCDHVQPAQVVACRALYRELSDVATQIAATLDEWQNAYASNDKPKAWDSKRRYAQFLAKFRELSKAAWEPNYFPNNVWSSKRYGATSRFLVGYTNELANSLAVRNNSCINLPGDQAITCQKDWDEYADAIKELLAVSAQVNQALQNNDQDAYLSSYVKEADLFAKVIDIEAVVKPKYLGQ
jgi:murein L,D-transpeptidase YcbB/YkuD